MLLCWLSESPRSLPNASYQPNRTLLIWLPTPAPNSTGCSKKRPSQKLMSPALTSPTESPSHKWGMQGLLVKRRYCADNSRVLDPS